jgi:hypothetical protein
MVGCQNSGHPRESMLCWRELRFGTPQAILSVTGSNPRLSDSGSLASMVRLARDTLITCGCQN